MAEENEELYMGVAMKDEEQIIDKTIWHKTEGICAKCNSLNVECRRVDSSDGAYEDWNYRCMDCNNYWWVDGIDS